MEMRIKRDELHPKMSRDSEVLKRRLIPRAMRHPSPSILHPPQPLPPLNLEATVHRRKRRGKYHYDVAIYEPYKLFKTG